MSPVSLEVSKLPLILTIMFFNLFKLKPTYNDKIFLYNTASGKKEEFEPIREKELTMYSCGPTVYDHIHIGNLRAYLLPDIITRLFLYQGYKVSSVINFTDFGHLTDDGDAGEDKIMKGLKREGMPVTLESMREFAETYIESFKKDNKKFGNLPPTQYARASDYIKQQINLIETLEEKGYAYETSDGVYFEISKFPQYGILGNVDIEKIKAGARVEQNPEKKHPADFALWKKGKLGWNSKWGQGFPGWHIECTAMIFNTLGKSIDIHTGGEDLMYTHHNGEIAQAECATGKEYVHYWLHNAHITINDHKLSKSADNGIRIEDLVKAGYSPLDYRYWLLQSHYRTSANFSYEALDGAKQALLRLRRLVYEDWGDTRPGQVNEKYKNCFLEALSDDLDTPKAISIIWELVKDESLPTTDKLATIQHLDPLLGPGLNKSVADGKSELGFINQNSIPPEIKNLLEEREAARIAKNWEEADRLRDAIKLKGYSVEDSDTGVRITKNNP